MPEFFFNTDIARHIWETKYQFRSDGEIVDRSVDDTWRRIARSLAAVEPENPAQWEQQFYAILQGFKFLPAGRIQAGAGTGRDVTLFNCFVMGNIDDSMDGIFDALKQGALTMQQGGGVGYDFSTLRPHGALARRTGSVASGPVSFMKIWDSMCATLLSTGARRGAMMATLRCDHPDISAFIDAKRDQHALRNFNLSVQVSDAFMDAVRNDRNWQLVFPADAIAETDGKLVRRNWPGRDGETECRVLAELPAKKLWAQLMRATYDYAEPGVLFVDHINNMNNLYYREHISASNPCGEVPLPPYGACNLGSINLTCFVKDPFSKNAAIDTEELISTVATAVRLMDNVISTSNFPLAAQREQAEGSRRIGLGMTGLGDALIMLGLRYDSPGARQAAADIMQSITHSAYRASIALAEERGPFPFFDRDAYLQSAFIKTLPDDIQHGIRDHGIRNSHLVAIAPTGTISLLANNISSGIEPVYDLEYSRRVREADGNLVEYRLQDFAYRQWKKLKGDAPLSDCFLRAWDVEPLTHLDMQAAVQPYVDSAISKTINIPEDFPFDEFKSLYEQAFDRGLKGCTTFRPNPVTGSILKTTAAETRQAKPHCCDIDREID
ncbi:MAG: ribonucleoside-diphosphate reductase [Acidithiobacillales bacterium SG8_45]|nr:MAG: ribonucleoside-diphosphate reductase [Acidithiobacillales bacterium SG8_45]